MDQRSQNAVSPLGWVLFFGTAAIGVALDLWTKALAVAHLKLAEPVRLIPNWLHFTYTENQGAVFGLGQGQRWLFIAVSIGAIAFLIYLLALSGAKRFYQVLLGMLVAGVIGNMYDRVVYGHVRDMIHALPGIYWPDWIARMLPANLANASVFPWIFNVADSLLCVGVFLIVVYSLVHQPQEEPKAQQFKPQVDTQGGK
ncbi:MAG TPA: signal peptidase II [Tepidisphaeraceae bacterium]|jgi:signal peptidase II